MGHLITKEKATTHFEAPCDTCVCSKKKLCAIYGKWTECLYTVDADTFDAHKKSDKKNSEEKKSNMQVQYDVH